MIYDNVVKLRVLSHSWLTPGHEGGYGLGRWVGLFVVGTLEAKFPFPFLELTRPGTMSEQYTCKCPVE